MRSLMTDDELGEYLRSVDWPIKDCDVREAYGLSEPDVFPCIIYDEIVNVPNGRPMTTADGGIEEGPTRVAYQITVLARDCKIGKKTVDRRVACRRLIDTVVIAMMARYGMQRSDTSECVPYDAVCDMQTVTFEGVIDTHDYTYSVR